MRIHCFEVIYMRIYAKKLVVSLLASLLTGALAALLIREGVQTYGLLEKPALSPPAGLFPIVWTILYLLMGVAAYLVWAEGKSPRIALIVYAVQLVFNFIWPLLFFNAQAYGVAFFWLLVLWLLVVATIILFFRQNKAAGFLMLPYLLWLTFAAYLNYAVWMLN